MNHYKTVDQNVQMVIGQITILNNALQIVQQVALCKLIQTIQPIDVLFNVLLIQIILLLIIHFNVSINVLLVLQCLQIILQELVSTIVQVGIYGLLLIAKVDNVCINAQMVLLCRILQDHVSTNVMRVMQILKQDTV